MYRLIGLFAIAVTSFAQTSFEVSSVRITPPGNVADTSISPSGAGTFTATNVSMEVLIGIAYGMDSERISGKQNWLGSEHYDVSAKAEGGREISPEQLKPMLQQLLADRFKLSVHWETKDSSGYALVAAKDGPKLAPTKGGPPRPMILRGGLRANNISLKVFAGMLARPTGRPVIDKTGLEGNFDLNLEYAPEGATDSSLPSIFTALQEQLGLKLIPQRVPLAILVIDHVEKIPTEN